MRGGHSQLNSLVPETAVLNPPGALGGHCPSDQGAARLASLDLACETRRLADFLRALVAAAALSKGLVGEAPHIRPPRSGSVDHASVDAFLEDATRNETVQEALRRAAECDERWYNQTDWSRCQVRAGSGTASFL